MNYHTIKRLSDGSELVPYNIPEYPVYANHGRISVYKNQDSTSHWHYDFEFSVMREGTMRYDVNGKSFTISKGQGLFINSAQLHKNYSYEGTDCMYDCVLLNKSLLGVSAYLDENYITRLSHNASIPYVILNESEGWNKNIMDGITSIVDELTYKSAVFALNVESIAFNMISELVRHMPSSSVDRQSTDRKSMAILSMVGFIQNHYAEKISLLEIAKAGNMSVSGCIAVFKRVFKQTPVMYLTRYRLEKGMELLSNPNITVTEAALSVGFMSASYFTESLGKYYGMTPTSYRQGLEKQ